VEALSDRNFRLLFAARGISYVGTYLAPIAVAGFPLGAATGGTIVATVGSDTALRRRRRWPASRSPSVAASA